jgi:uncharacterized protein (DUF1800 family)
MDQRLTALNRFGMGARVGEAGRIGDPRQWLLDQLDAQKGERPGADVLPNLADIAAALKRVAEAAADKNQDELKAARKVVRDIASKEARAVLEQRIKSEAPFVERLVAFFSNHFCVSIAGNRQGVVALAGHYEREAIRPHVLGRFSDMVLASARHPAMLLYLDNVQSVGPRSPAAQRQKGRKRDINENYARELLELHTVGVDGGYTQNDVRQLALVLSGWNVSGLGPRNNSDESPGFAFRLALHEPGEKTVMGRRYAEAGVNEGEQVIRDLCRHESTARFVATKLAGHFVADDPPPTAVARLAAVFRDAEGDLKAVARALIGLDEAWSPNHRKYRTPQDWLVAALRALGAEKLPEGVLQSLNKLRHGMWSPLSPKGYGDTLNDWADPDGLLKRAELARTIARNVKAAGPEPPQLTDCMTLNDDDPLPTLLRDGEVPRNERLALALAGPAFQWR